MYKVLVQQPQFLPWIGYWSKVAMADKHIVYAGVQAIRDGHQHRVSISGVWVTVPTIRSMGTLIKDVQIDKPERSLGKIAKTIQHSYGSSKFEYRDRVAPLIELLRAWRSKWLLELQLETLELLGEALGITPTTVVYLGGGGEGTKVDKLQQCLASEADEIVLVSGAGGKDLGYESIPNVKRIMYQRVKSEVSKDSVLGLLVSVDNPLAVIKASSTWE